MSDSCRHAASTVAVEEMLDGGDKQALEAHLLEALTFVPLCDAIQSSAKAALFLLGLFLLCFSPWRYFSTCHFEQRRL